MDNNLLAHENPQNQQPQKRHTIGCLWVRSFTVVDSVQPGRILRGFMWTL